MFNSAGVLILPSDIQYLAPLALDNYTNKLFPSRNIASTVSRHTRLILCHEFSSTRAKKRIFLNGICRARRGQAAKT